MENMKNSELSSAPRSIWSSVYFEINADFPPYFMKRAVAVVLKLADTQGHTQDRSPFLKGETMQALRMISPDMSLFIHQYDPPDTQHLTEACMVCRAVCEFWH